MYIQHVKSKINILNSPGNNDKWYLSQYSSSTQTACVQQGKISKIINANLNITKCITNKWKPCSPTGLYSRTLGIISVLTINIHDADAHYTGDNDQGETGSVVVHQQQPVDSCLCTTNHKWFKMRRGHTSCIQRSHTVIYELPVSSVECPVRTQLWPLTRWWWSCAWWSSLYQSHRRWPSPESRADRTTQAGTKQL